MLNSSDTELLKRGGLHENSDMNKWGWYSQSPRWYSEMLSFMTMFSSEFFVHTSKCQPVLFLVKNIWKGIFYHSFKFKASVLCVCLLPCQILIFFFFLSFRWMYGKQLWFISHCSFDVMAAAPPPAAKSNVNCNFVAQDEIWSVNCLVRFMLHFPHCAGFNCPLALQLESADITFKEALVPCILIRPLACEREKSGYITHQKIPCVMLMLCHADVSDIRVIC